MLKERGISPCGYEQNIYDMQWHLHLEKCWDPKCKDAQQLIERTFGKGVKDDADDTDMLEEWPETI